MCRGKYGIIGNIIPPSPQPCHLLLRTSLLRDFCFGWKRLLRSFTGGASPANTAALLLPALELITPLVCWVRDSRRSRQDRRRQSGETISTDGGCLRERTENPLCMCVCVTCVGFLCVCEPVLCGGGGEEEDEGVSAASSRCRRLSSSFISLSYSTHSGTIRAAAVSLGSFVLGLLHCSRKQGRGVSGGEGGGADKTHQSQQHQCHFLPATHICRSQHSLRRPFKA